jgi:hypothetical protein
LAYRETSSRPHIPAHGGSPAEKYRQTSAVQGTGSGIIEANVLYHPSAEGFGTCFLQSGATLVESLRNVTKHDATS